MKKCQVANTFQDAAIHFLLEPFMDQEDIDTQPDKHLPILFIWVIGPYIPENEDGNASKNQLYYHIVVAVTFHKWNIHHLHQVSFICH